MLRIRLEKGKEIFADKENTCLRTIPVGVILAKLSNDFPMILGKSWGNHWKVLPLSIVFDIVVYKTKYTILKIIKRSYR